MSHIVCSVLPEVISSGGGRESSARRDRCQGSAGATSSQDLSPSWWPFLPHLVARARSVEPPPLPVKGQQTTIFQSSPSSACAIMASQLTKARHPRSSPTTGSHVMLTLIGSGISDSDSSAQGPLTATWPSGHREREFGFRMSLGPAHN